VEPRTIYDPQSWNRYTYTLNNPLRHTGPFGLYIFAPGVEDGYKKKFQQGLKDLQKARDFFKKGSLEYNRLDRALKAYGEPGVDNGVTITFGTIASAAAATTEIGLKIDATGAKATTTDNPTGQNITVTIDPAKQKSDNDYVFIVGHEGSHVADDSALVGALPNTLNDKAAYQTVLDGPLNLTKYVTEKAAYEVISFVAQGRGAGVLTVGAGQYEVWNSGWKEADRATQRAAGINRVLAEPTNKKGLYEVTPTNQGPKLIE
jgi:hypothetical protein